MDFAHQHNPSKLFSETSVFLENPHCGFYRQFGFLVEKTWILLNLYYHSITMESIDGQTPFFYCHGPTEYQPVINIDAEFS